jgi:hypothetical protein
MKVKTETIQEFLARGGKITKLEFKQHEAKEQVTRQAPGGPANILSLDEADLFFGEAKVKKTKPKPNIDLSALPPELKAKFIAKLSEEIEEDGDDEEE